METTKMKILYRKQNDSHQTRWQSTTNIDEFISPESYLLSVINDDGSHKMPFRFANDEVVTMVVKNHEKEDRTSDRRTIVQTITRVERSSGKEFTYTRTRCNIRKKHIWSKWEELQKSIKIGEVSSLDIYTDSGNYSGVYTDGTVCENFSMVVIDNKDVANVRGNVRSVSQFKYSLNLDGTFSYKTRTGQGDTSITWGEWMDIGAADTTDIQDNSITAQKLSTDVRKMLENVTNMKNAIQIDSPQITSDVEKVSFCCSSIEGNKTITVNIPSATTTHAGVMSAEDKKSVGIDSVKTEHLFKGVYADFDFNLDSNTQHVGVLVEAGNSIDYFRVVGLAEDGNVEYVTKEDSIVGKWMFFKLTKRHDKLRVIFSESYIKEDTNAIITVKGCNNLSLAVAQNKIAIEGNRTAIEENTIAINENKTLINGLEEKVYKQSKLLADKTIAISLNESLYVDIIKSTTEVGEYVINVDNISASISSFRLVGYKVAGGTVTLLAHPQEIGKDITFQVGETLTSIRLIIETNYIAAAGDISVVIRTPSYDIQEDLNAIKENVEKNTQDIESLKPQTNVADIMFPVPNDIYCAVGTDMNLYYENMFGMLLGSGYMFIDSPNVVYDTSADDSGGYDKPLNLERQFHFKPNEAGTMELYLNVWNDCMQQVAAKSTLLHIVDPVAASGKTVNMLVNGSSSIDMGFMQAEIKLLLEAAGATVNMVGRWASGNVDDPRENARYDVPNRLSENRSGGDSSLYTTKANSGKTVIVHPTNLVESFYQYDAVLQDDAGNTWNVWGNSADFCELVLKSGDISTIPASGALAKISGKGPESFTYDRLITDVPQTTNPFWSDTLNGISFAEYCSNWNRPTPNVFVTLWGTNDIKGSGGNIRTGKQWATDAQIKTFVERQKILVDAFTRDCPEGVVIMCPQPTGSSLTGKKNSDRNGMLYSKLKATQALMDAFAGYDNVIIVPVLWWFDRKYSYTAKDVTMSERMAEYYGDKYLDVVTDDSTHPDARGYYQMADAAYSAIVYWLDKKIA